MRVGVNPLLVDFEIPKVGVSVVRALIIVILAQQAQTPGRKTQPAEPTVISPTANTCHAVAVGAITRNLSAFWAAFCIHGDKVFEGGNRGAGQAVVLNVLLQRLQAYSAEEVATSRGTQHINKGIHAFDDEQSSD